MRRILPPLLIASAIFLFFTALSNLQQGHNDKDKAQLEAALTKAAVACYAAEGIYPPDLDYLTGHYGIQINENLYAVKYDVIASNLMPDITILEKEQ